MALVDRPRRSVAFRDISFQFLKHPVTDDIGAFSNEAAIKRSVQNLVRTRYGERFFEPLLGSTVEVNNFEIICKLESIKKQLIKIKSQI